MASFFRPFFLLRLLLAGTLLSAISCSNKIPEPEKTDPLYMELEREITGALAEVKLAEEGLAEAESNYKKAVPQTGQIKYATKRLNDAKYRLQRAKQIALFFKVKHEARKWEAREEYLSSYYNKTPWPNQEPLEMFRLKKRLMGADRNWSANKRREELGLPIKSTQKDTQNRDPAAAK